MSSSRELFGSAPTPRLFSIQYEPLSCVAFRPSPQHLCASKPKCILLSKIIAIKKGATTPVFQVRTVSRGFRGSQPVAENETARPDSGQMLLDCTPQCRDIFEFRLCRCCATVRWISRRRLSNRLPYVRRIFCVLDCERFSGVRMFTMLISAVKEKRSPW